MKKLAILAGLCITAVSMSACSSQKRVVGSKGDQYSVKKDVEKVSNEAQSGDKAYEPYTITLNLERSGAGQNMEETFTSAPNFSVIWYAKPAFDKFFGRRANSAPLLSRVCV